MPRAVILMIALCALSACETAKGIGRDITRAANAVDRAL